MPRLCDVISGASPGWSAPFDIVLNHRLMCLCSQPDDAVHCHVRGSIQIIMAHVNAAIGDLLLATVAFATSEIGLSSKCGLCSAVSGVFSLIQIFVTFIWTSWCSHRRTCVGWMASCQSWSLHCPLTASVVSCAHWGVNRAGVAVCMLSSRSTSPHGLTSRLCAFPPLSRDLLLPEIPCNNVCRDVQHVLPDSMDG